MSRRRCFSPTASSCSATVPRASRPTSRSIVPIPGTAAIPQLAELRREHSGAARIGRDMVSAQGNSIRKELPRGRSSGHLRLRKAACVRIRARAAQHDREASFPFENFDRAVRGGITGADGADGARRLGRRRARCARIISIFGKADPSTALVLSMHYIQHLVMAQEHALAGPSGTQAGPRNRRRRGADQRPAGRA